MKADICRICSEDNCDNVLLFGQYRDKYDIVHIIFELTAIKLEQGELLPSNLCTICADKLVEFHLFREKILKSEEKLSKEDSLKAPVCSDSNEFAFVNVKQEEFLYQTDAKPDEACKTGNELNADASTSVRAVRSKKQKKHNLASTTSKVANLESCDQADKDGNEAKRKKFICDQCNRDFRYPSRFIAHYRNIHLKQYERTVCPYCPRAFTLSSNSNSNLRRHIRNVHENVVKEESKYPTIKCNECDSVFWGSLEMYEHSKIHEPNCKERDDGYNLCCDMCNIDLESYDKFATHLKETHGVTNEKEIKPVRCRWCGERCKSLQGLYTHIRLVHKCEGTVENSLATSDMINMAPIEKSTSFLCTVCGKVLGSQISYKNHMIAHRGEKPFVCDVCPARFSQKFYLNNHKLTHSQIRKYTCTECDKAFRQSAHLKSHLKTHGIGIKEKYPCPICKKDFLFRGTLREHMWVHKEGEIMPHVCIDCGKGFLWKNKLELHIRKGQCKQYFLK